MGSGVSYNHNRSKSAPTSSSGSSNAYGPAGSVLLKKASIIFNPTARTTSLCLNGSHKNSGNIQEEANSFKAKAGTLKMLIKNKNSRTAFFTFLEKTHHGREELLDYFLFIESIKKGTDSHQARNQFLEVIKKYAAESEGKPSDSNASAIYSSTHTWKDIKTLPPEEMTKHMTRSQDEVLLVLTPLFESFLLSNYYKEFGKNEMANERRNYGSATPCD